MSELSLGLELQQVAHKYDSPVQAVWALLECANRILGPDHSPPEVLSDIAIVLIKHAEETAESKWPELDRLFQQYFANS
jgi:hypothetical protein